MLGRQQRSWYRYAMSALGSAFLMFFCARFFLRLVSKEPKPPRQRKTPESPSRG